MSWIVLAAGLGANFTLVALLFRRERHLSRQLSDMRAERNSEWILHALRGVPNEQAAPAVNGDFQPFPAGPEPVRRKRHLGLFLGGGGVAVLAGLRLASRRAWQERPGLVLAGGVAVATAATVAVVLIGAHQSGDTGAGPAPSEPTATATATASRSPGGSSTPAPPTSAPGTTPTPRMSGSRSLTPTATSPGGEASSGAGLPPTRSAPAATPSPTGPPPVEPSDTPSPSTTSGTRTRCLDVPVEPVLDLAICLAGGG